jgi:hypothetical protein
MLVEVSQFMLIGLHDEPPVTERAYGLTLPPLPFVQCQLLRVAVQVNAWYSYSVCYPCSILRN